MLSQVDTPIAEETALSDRLMILLRKRIKDRKDQELLEYIDDLLPSYEISDAAASKLDDRKLTYQLADFLEYYGEEFVEISYLCLFKRRVDSSGLQTGAELLRSGECSRIHLLGRLRYSEEGNTNGVEVKGLWVRYFFARLRKIPVLGVAAGFVLGFDYLSRLGQQLEKQNEDVSHTNRAIDAVENSLLTHCRETTQKLESSVGLSPQPSNRPVGTRELKESRPARLAEFTGLSGREFLYLGYHTILGREPLAAEVRVGLGDLSSGSKSKTKLLGDLYELEEAKGCRDDIAGLSYAYRYEKLLSVPLIGSLLKIPRTLRILSRLDSILEFQSGEIADCNRKLADTEIQFMTHYNSTLLNLKRELVEALKADNKQG